MKKVTILGFDNTLATTLFGPMDIFNQAGRLWNRVHKAPSTPAFDVAIASADGKPIRLTNNVVIQPHASIASIDRTDLVVIASATDIDQILETHPQLIAWIRRQYAQGAHVASVCTGVFLLAETGLLNGKSVTLHWGFTRMFQDRYPKVNLDADRMVIDHGRLYCSAGANAGMDLSLYLVEKFCSRQTAVECAKTLVLDLGRTAQTPYGSFLIPGDHGDPVVLDIQKLLEGQPTRPVDYERLARDYRMSRRSLERRFKAATGITLLGYIQQLRVEAAKRLLEEGRHTFNEITYLVGYEDITFFRKIFVRITGLRPKAYQRRFAGYGLNAVPSTTTCTGNRSSPPESRRI
jgi:transcriptional regulator GlxA family with amidase domain